MSGPTYLAVPYAEKNEAKQLGARWDPAERAWYVPSGVDTAAFARWLGDVAGSPAPPVEAARERVPVAEATPGAQVAPEAMGLADYLSRAGLIVREHLAAPTWVVAEIAEANLQRQGHLYLTFAETAPDGHVRAQARGVCFNAERCGWWREFVDVVGQAPAVGMKVLVQVGCELNIRYGFTLRIHAIDPSFTVGEFARKVAQIRKQLESEGVLRAQDAHPAPVDFTRIAVIAPAGAAGLGDFQRDAELLQQLELVRFTYIVATFQGGEAEGSLLSALDTLETFHRDAHFDAAILLRGGGSQLDLDWLNSLEVARAIATASLPVFTAIGHERDHVALDDVAHRSFDTPSKAIAHVRQTVTARTAAAARDLLLIEKAARARIDRLTQRLDAGWQRTGASAQRHLATLQGQTQTRYIQVAEAARGRLHRAGADVAQMYAGTGRIAQQRISKLQATVSTLDQRAQHGGQVAVQRMASAVDAMVLRLGTTAGRRIDRAVVAIERSFEGLGAVARRRVEQLELGVERTWHQVALADPERILERGFVLVQQDGRTVTHASMADGLVTLRWRDGTRTARIEPDAPTS